MYLEKVDYKKEEERRTIFGVQLSLNMLLLRAKYDSHLSNGNQNERKATVKNLCNYHNYYKKDLSRGLA